MDSSTKEVLIGRFGKLPTPGNQVPNLAELRKPFAHGGVVYSFCTGCGYLTELTKAGAQDLLREAGVSDQLSLVDYYFVTGHCPACSDNFDQTRFLPIG